MNNEEFKEVVKKADDRTKLDKLMDMFVRPATVGFCIVVIMESICKRDLPSWLFVATGVMLGMLLYSFIQICYYSNNRIHANLTLQKDLALVDIIRDMDKRIKELEETKKED